MRHLLVYDRDSRRVVARISTRTATADVLVAYPGCDAVDVAPETQWAPGMVLEDDDTLTISIPAPSWQEKRLRSMAEGGYGSVAEQLEMLYDQGLDAWRQHVSAVKARHPKP